MFRRKIDNGMRVIQQAVSHEMVEVMICEETDPQTNASFLTRDAFQLKWLRTN